MTPEAMRRGDDSSLIKMMKLWPLIVGICGIIAAWSINSLRVEAHGRALAEHETRLSHVEINAAVARINTDALVERILSPEEKRALGGQIETISTYLLETSKARQGGHE